VLDEADRMMDMGFWPDVQKIMSALPPDRQTLLFSATLPGEIQRMAKEMLKEPRYVQVGARGGAARTIDHQMVKVETGEKIDWLATFAKRESDGPVLVFVRRKIDADRVTRSLMAKSIRAAALHADRTQQERLSAVEGFRSGKHPGAGGHRHRRARPRHRGHRARRQFRSPGLAGNVRAPRRSHRTRRRLGTRGDAGFTA
jgi:ATP-dependent RNA helicase RhlE